MPSDPQATFIAHRQELLAWFTYRLRDTHLARDLVQELFIRFIEAAPAAGVQDARAYLFQIARNMLADRARQQAVRRTDNVAHEDLARIADDAPGPEQTNLGAAFLLKAAARLELHAGFGARHLAPHAEGRATNWRGFIAQLDELALPSEQEGQVEAGARAAFTAALAHAQRCLPVAD